MDGLWICYELLINAVLSDNDGRIPAIFNILMIWGNDEIPSAQHCSNILASFKSKLWAYIAVNGYFMGKK